MRPIWIAVASAVVALPLTLASAGTADAKPGWKGGHGGWKHGRGFHRGPPRWAPAHGYRRKHRGYGYGYGYPRYGVSYGYPRGYRW